jgi:hypothetical protein
MKTATKIVFILTLVLGLVLGTTAKTAQAAIGVIGDIDDNWTSGVEVSIDLVQNPAPFEWLQLIGSGVKVTAPGTLCTEFRKGQFGWTAQVYQLVSGYWVYVPTTQGWFNGTGAKYMACATVPSTGTYALFAYYVPPADKKVGNSGPSMPECDGFEIVGYVWNEDAGDNYTDFVISFYEGSEDPNTWTYEVLSFETSEYADDPAVIISGITGSIESRLGGGYAGHPVYTEIIQQMLIRLYTNTCYVDWEFIWT